jgi:hypothetical protein
LDQAIPSLLQAGRQGLEHRPGVDSDAQFRREDAMRFSRVPTLLAVAFVAAIPGVATAQFPPPPAPSASPSPTVRDRWPDPTKPQAEEPLAPAQPAPRRQPAQARPAPQDDAAAAPAPARRAAPRVPATATATAVTCGGIFAKNTSHLKLAQRYDSRNVVFGPVDGPEGSKINATIVFPNDPKRRLEVLWSNEGSRADISVIAINGQSQWRAPKGLKLGLAIAALEKLNGKPFKLTGFAADGSASVLSWEGGALNVLPGGCKVGMRLFEDAKSPEAARSAVAGSNELLSSDPRVRAVKPAVGEILIGY